MKNQEVTVKRTQPTTMRVLGASAVVLVVVKQANNLLKNTSCGVGGGVERDMSMNMNCGITKV